MSAYALLSQACQNPLIHSCSAVHSHFLMYAAVIMVPKVHVNKSWFYKFVSETKLCFTTSDSGKIGPQLFSPY